MDLYPPEATDGFRLRSHERRDCWIAPFGPATIVSLRSDSRAKATPERIAMIWAVAERNGIAQVAVTEKQRSMR
jgi:hypothetical protein